MKKHMFERLVNSMEQHNEIARGERAPSRETHIAAIEVEQIRAATIRQQCGKISQTKRGEIVGRKK